MLKPPQVETVRCCRCRAGCLFGLGLAVIVAVLDAGETCQLLQPCGLMVIVIVTGLLHLQQCGGHMIQAVGQSMQRCQEGTKDISVCDVGFAAYQPKVVGLLCAVRNSRCTL